MYPFGDWCVYAGSFRATHEPYLSDRLGTVQPYDVPGILDEILERQAELAAKQYSGSAVKPAPILCPVFWRGRMGLDKDGQIELASRS